MTAGGYPLGSTTESASQGSKEEKMRFRALDLCCCAGGMSAGIAAAGFEVFGSDIEWQPHYPYWFKRRDFRTYTYAELDEFDYIHISPPCQQYSRASVLARKHGRVYPDLYHEAKALCISSGKPYTIENVPGSPAKGIRLFGWQFGLNIIRERIFESNIPLTDLGREKAPGKVKGGDFVTVAGSGKGNHQWEAAMGIDWADPEEIKEAVPPLMARFVADQIMTWLVNEQRLQTLATGAPMSTRCLDKKLLLI